MLSESVVRLHNLQAESQTRSGSTSGQRQDVGGRITRNRLTVSTSAASCDSGWGCMCVSVCACECIHVRVCVHACVCVCQKKRVMVCTVLENV